MCHFYVKVIKQGNELFTGYGITDNLKTRDEEHLDNLTRAGYEVVSTESFKFASREAAKNLENQVKHNTRLVDLKVDGFRTEAAPIAQLGFIMSMAAVAAAGKPAQTAVPQESEYHYSDDLLDGLNKIRLSNTAYIEMQLEKAWSSKGVVGDTYRKEVKERLALSLKNLHSNERDIEIYIPEYWEGAYLHTFGHYSTLTYSTNGYVAIRPSSNNEKTKYHGQGYKVIKLDFLRRDIVRRQEKIKLEKETRAEEKAKNAKKAWINSLTREDQELLACDIWSVGRHDTVEDSVNHLKAGQTQDTLEDFKERLAGLKQSIS